MFDVFGGSYGLSGLLSFATTRACRHFQALMWASTSFALKRIGASSRIAGLRQSAAASCRTIASRARYSASTRLMTLARVCLKLRSMLGEPDTFRAQVKLFVE